MMTKWRGKCWFKIMRCMSLKRVVRKLPTVVVFSRAQSPLNITLTDLVKVKKS